MEGSCSHGILLCPALTPLKAPHPTLLCEANDPQKLMGAPYTQQSPQHRYQKGPVTHG